MYTSPSISFSDDGLNEAREVVEKQRQVIEAYRVAFPARTRLQNESEVIEAIRRFANAISLFDGIPDDDRNKLIACGLKGVLVFDDSPFFSDSSVVIDKIAVGGQVGQIPEGSTHGSLQHSVFLHKCAVSDCTGGIHEGQV